MTGGGGYDIINIENKDMEMKKVEKERKIKVLSLVALIVAVLGLTVAFAALSQTLTINGTASVDAATWDIHFENLDGWETGQDLPTLNGTSITNMIMTVSKPNDEHAYVVDMKNAGTINAKISSIEVSKLCTLSSPIESCDWDNDGMVTQSDVQKVEDNISLSIFYIDDNINDGNPTQIKKDDVLKAGEKKTMAITLDYLKVFSNDDGSMGYVEATELPKRNLVFNNLSVIINYVQAD